jgi:Arc/MetJ-type ribon-helix-helix transcriptional regulator
MLIIWLKHIHNLYLFFVKMSEGIYIKIPDMLREEADLYVESGYFENRSELIREAIRELLERLEQNKTRIATDLYRREKVSLGRSAEIAGLGYEKMKELLIQRGIPIRRGPESVVELAKEGIIAKDLL